MVMANNIATMFTQPAPPSFYLQAMVSSSAPKRSTQKVRLPPSFAPGEYTVICGCGKLYSSSPGNQFLRSLVNEYLTPYANAKTKQDKTVIVSAIIECVREHSPLGAFVKQDDHTGGWWEVDDSFAREKIGCIFRDKLHKQYRSSTKAKQARKKKEKKSFEDSPSKEPSNATKPQRAGSKSPYQNIEKGRQVSPAIAPPTFAEAGNRLIPAEAPSACAGPTPNTQVKSSPSCSPSSCFNRLVSPTSSSRPTDPILLGQMASLARPCWQKDQAINAMTHSKMPDYGFLPRRSLRMDVHREFQMFAPFLQTSSSLPMGGETIRRNALSWVLENALGTLDKQALLQYQQQEEDFPDDLSNIFDDELEQV